MLIYNQSDNLDELQTILLQAELVVTQAHQTHDAIEAMVQSNPAFIFLDLDVEDSTDFLQFVSRSTHFNPPPYILTAATFFDGPDQVALYNFGTDACIVKPIKPNEVVALVNAVLRREQKIARLNSERLIPCIEHKNLVINPVSRTVLMRGKDVTLTAKEFDVLYLLAKHPGIVLKREEIYEMVWREYNKVGSGSVSDHIHMIRRKLGLDGNDHEYIQTVYHVGYRFVGSD